MHRDLDRDPLEGWGKKTWPEREILLACAAICWCTLRRRYVTGALALHIRAVFPRGMKGCPATGRQRDTMPLSRNMLSSLHDPPLLWASNLNQMPSRPYVAAAAQIVDETYSHRPLSPWLGERINTKAR